ncbi:SDR family NAD(P)-dependent oxidoreductase [Balneola sp. MJW-20]|uniref:SDR family NAD(P)-dependent oxidoreductase n=1 Tax=Gracilimonas aurantiaca TaxID=3234185 RepID=UPI003467929F
MPRILITGATSGIGKELAHQLSDKGHILSLVGRREERLQEIQNELKGEVYIHPLDVTDLDMAEKVFKELIEKMGGMDIMILNAGVGRARTMNPWEVDEQIIDVNVRAFSHGLHYAFTYFMEQGHGHIVGISSIASLAASHRAAAYTASKHFISNYMTGFRQKARRFDADIYVTDIRPGFVWTEMTQNNKGMFWVAPVEKATRQIVKAIEKKKSHAYITKRWRLVAWVLKLVPQWLWDRI